MAKRAFLVHCWDGNPDDGWYPSVAQDLEQKGVSVERLTMPNPAIPKMDPWISTLAKAVDKAFNSDTVFIGHSIGCQTILRYAATQNGKSAAGAVLVAPWLTLSGLGPEELEIAAPWLDTPINFKGVCTALPKISCIFSDNDPYVPQSNIAAIKDALNCEIQIERKMGHISAADGIMDLKIVSDAALKMLGMN